MSLLIDIEPAPCGCTNHGLESLYKAMAEEPDEGGIWAPHDNPWLSDICEDFTRQGQRLISAAQNALLAALGFDSLNEPLRKASLSGQWTEKEVRAVQQRLHGKPIEAYTPDDWMLFIDFILQTRMPDGALEESADWLSWRSSLAGAMDAATQADASLPPIDALLGILTGAQAGKAPLPKAGAEVWPWARARIGMHLTAMRDGMKHKIGLLIADHFQHRGLSRPAKLEQGLRDAFGEMNRDWRRVAITEAGEAANLTYLSEFPDGTRVQRLEAYEGACAFCRKINGQVFTWSESERPEGDGWTHVWPGKTNVGRSASPRKRTLDGLVERTPDELWWPAAGVQHPHCRGRWLALPDESVPPGVDPDFAAWLKGQIDGIAGQS